jgi:HAMP domain-containing protein
MKRRLVLIFVVLFLLLAGGVATSVYFLWRSSNELGRVVEAHAVEELRQALGQKLQRSIQDLQASGTAFANNLDGIIANVQALDASVQGCFDCHHAEERRRDLERVASLVERYKAQYSTFITAFLDHEQRLRLQIEAASTAQEIDSAVAELLLLASPRLKERTERALAEMRRSWQILAVTLALTFAAAAVLSLLLVRSVTRPLARLAGAVKRISAGDLGLQVQHEERHEVGVLMDAFNEMSAALKVDDERIRFHSARLTQLKQALLLLNSHAEPPALLGELVKAVQALVAADIWGTVLEVRGLGGAFLVGLGAAGETKAADLKPLSREHLERIWHHSSFSTMAPGPESGGDWPLGTWPLDVPLRNFMIAWLELDGKLRGALIVANKKGGDFTDEDGELLSALGHGSAAVMERMYAYQNLQHDLQKLERQARDKGPPPGTGAAGHTPA